MEKSQSGSITTPKAGHVFGLVSDAATSAHSGVDKVSEAAGSAVRSVNSAIDKATESSHQAVNRIEDSVKPAEQWVREKTDAVLAVPKNAVSDARQYIVTHPWQSLGFAVLAGLLLGRRTR